MLRKRRRRRKRPNWPYRLAWLTIWLALIAYAATQTWANAMSVGRRSYGIDWGLSLVASLFDTTVAIFFVVVGACIGSFLNVVAYRLPLGRFIGGHSACPYCCTPIDGLDNVPVLAWIKLRGRCHTCRLPISVQYPLVELTVAVLFFIVYATEFATGGANLPGIGRPNGSGGVLRVNVTPVVILQLASYLFLLCGLVAAALIAVKRRRIPLQLYMWCVLPLAISGVCLPETIVVPWRDSSALTAQTARLDVLVTLACGAAAGIAIARLLSPLAYRNFDRSLMAGDSNTATVRQFAGAMAVAGCLVGWQSCVPLAWTIVMCALLSALSLRWLFRLQTPPAPQVNLGDLTVWVWLGLLLFRINWEDLIDWQILPSAIPEVGRQVLGALLLAPLVWMLRERTQPAEIAAIVTEEHEHEV